MIKLGLLGKNISKSQAPSLIIKLGKEFEIDLSYELFQDNKIDNNFEEFLNFLKPSIKSWSVLGSTGKVGITFLGGSAGITFLLGSKMSG